MKYTGIVRRLDSLGRIVIPREYRKMHKINESDPLEIIALEDGEILIRKVDVSAELVSSGASIMEGIFEETQLNVAISNKDKFLKTVGGDNSSLINKNISSKSQGFIEDRKIYNGKAQEVGLEGEYVLVCPIFKEDIFGAIYLFSSTEISKEDERLVNSVSKIFGGLMQKY